MLSSRYTNTQSDRVPGVRIPDNLVDKIVSYNSTYLAPDTRLITKATSLGASIGFVCTCCSTPHGSKGSTFFLCLLCHPSARPYPLSNCSFPVGIVLAGTRGANGRASVTCLGTSFACKSIRTISAWSVTSFASFVCNPATTSSFPLDYGIPLGIIVTSSSSRCTRSVTGFGTCILGFSTIVSGASASPPRVGGYPGAGSATSSPRLVVFTAATRWWWWIAITKGDIRIKVVATDLINNPVEVRADPSVNTRLECLRASIPPTDNSNNITIVREYGTAGI